MEGDRSVWKLIRVFSRTLNDLKNLDFSKLTMVSYAISVAHCKQNKLIKSVLFQLSKHFMIIFIILSRTCKVYT